MSGIYNPIELFFRELQFIDIPSDILQITFNPDRNPSISIHNLIYQKIIINKVLHDLNLAGGRTKNVILKREWRIQSVLNRNDRQYNNSSFVLYEIPNEYLENGIITNVIAINIPSLYNTLGGEYINRSYNTMNTYGSATSAVLDSNLNRGGGFRPKGIPEAPNIIRIEPGFRSHMDLEVVLKISIDPNLNTLPENLIRPFIELSTLALQAYIYNELIVKIERGYIEGGYEIGVIKELVERYSDKYIEYKEKLSSLPGKSAYSDPRSRQRMYYYMI
jgi:hypothetical protein